jgi:hypothetical protein
MVMSISHAEARQNGAAMIILGIALADYAKTDSLQDQVIAVRWIEIRLQTTRLFRSKSPLIWVTNGHRGVVDLRSHYAATFITIGTFQEPSRSDGSVALGQYNRIIKIKSPLGAGSQFASLSLPGDAFWM